MGFSEQMLNIFDLATIQTAPRALPKFTYSLDSKMCAMMRLGCVVVLQCLKASCINDLEELNVDFFKLATLPHLNRLPIHHPMNIRFSHETVHISMLL
jgi:hypothetical protein